MKDVDRIPMTVEERLREEATALAALIAARVDPDARLAELQQRRDRRTSSARHPGRPSSPPRSTRGRQPS
jgi:hypothetical protein